MINDALKFEFHELANFYPMQDPARFQELVEGMRRSGYRDEFPIVLYEGKILDGRNRYKAALEAGVEPFIVQFSGDDPVEFVIQANSNRRDLEPGQRVAIYKKIRTKYQKGGDRVTEQFVKFDKLNNSRKDFAEKIGVSTGTVAMVDVVEKTSPELFEKVASGEISANKAYKQIKNEQAKERFKEQTKEQAQIVPLVEVASCLDWLKNKPACDLLLADPPYSTDLDEPVAQFATWLPRALEQVKDTGRAYVFIGAYPDELGAYLNQKYPLHMCLEQVLIWEYKNTLGQNPKNLYKLNYQACLYFVGVNAPALDCPITNEQWAVIHANAPDGRLGDRFHSWQKPIEIAEMFIRHSTQPGALVYDPFVCTGTFLLAAAKLGRKGYGCDISKENLEIAIERGCQYADL